MLARRASVTLLQWPLMPNQRLHKNASQEKATPAEGRALIVVFLLLPGFKAGWCLRSAWLPWRRRAVLQLAQPALPRSKLEA